MTTQKLIAQAQQLETELRSTYIAFATTEPKRAGVLLMQAVAAAGIVKALEALPHAPSGCKATPEATGEREYRMLEAGERILDGDEVLRIFGGWNKVSMTQGTLLDPMSVGSFRRPVTRPVPPSTAESFQPVVDFHNRECSAVQDEKGVQK